MKKLLDTTKMQEIIEIDSLEVQEGIRRTVEWYIANREAANAKD
jgi:dTDP-D-glucose 4,6-dehydratase